MAAPYRKNHVKCDACNGTGKYEIEIQGSNEAHRHKIKCPVCDGSGQVRKVRMVEMSADQTAISDTERIAKLQAERDALAERVRVLEAEVAERNKWIEALEGSINIHDLPSRYSDD